MNTDSRRISTERLGRALAIAFASLALTWLNAGCKSTKRPGIEGYNALIRQQQEALAVEQLKQPTIYFRGNVQKPIVPWRENLTLAEGLLEAGYSSPFSPHSLKVTREGHSYPIDVRRLLRGTDNPVLEPGDVVEVYR